MGATVYTLKLATGDIVCGCIHGSGGMVGSGDHNAQRVRVQIERATAGKPLAIYEPERGHCAMYDAKALRLAYPQWCEAWRNVDLRGAELVGQEVL